MNNGKRTFCGAIIMFKSQVANSVSCAIVRIDAQEHFVCVCFFFAAVHLVRVLTTIFGNE